MLPVACGNVGPRTAAIMNDEDAVVVARAANEPYAVIEIDTDIANAASHLLKDRNRLSFISDSGAAPVIIGAGDILQISVVTTSDSGFLDLTNSTLSPISTTALPDQEVGSGGMVNVPPVGRVRAAGQTVQAFEQLLERRLGEILVDPSVVVRLAERRSARVSVLGDVADPGTIPIDQTNRRLIEMVALAGGPIGRAEDLRVSLSRGDRTSQARLDEIYENPRLNVLVQPGDVISVERPQHRITFLGANGDNATIRFDDPFLTLADALGRAGGLENRRADRKGVFIYRTLHREEAAKLGINVLGFQSAKVPAIFNLDVSKPQSLFAAKDFVMAPDDLIYVADSTNEELSAIFGVFTNFAPTPGDYVRDATID
jgi:polysaccharide export outer membrane protein